MTNLKNRLIDYARDTFGVLPEFPWEKYPQFAVLRHEENLKWFAIFMKIQKNKLGFQDDDDIEIINLKCEPLMIGSLIQKEGYFKAYHMNKEHWITIVLDGTVSKAEIEGLMNISFELTQKKRKNKPVKLME